MRCASAPKQSVRRGGQPNIGLQEKMAVAMSEIGADFFVGSAGKQFLHCGRAAEDEELLSKQSNIQPGRRPAETNQW